MLGISYACNFVLVPFLLGAWGPGNYGLWVTLTTAASYLALFDLGGQYYIQNLLAMSYARNDSAEFRRVLSRGMALFLWIGGAVLLFWLAAVTAGSMWSVPILGRPLTRIEGAVLICLGCNQCLVSIPFGVFVTAYRASGHFMRATVLGNINKIILFLLSLLVALMHAGPTALALATLFVGVISATILLYDSRRLIPAAVGLDVSWSSARQGLSLLHGSFFNWLIAVANLVNQSVPLLIIARYAPPEIVALFATHRTIAAVAIYVPGIVSGPIQPELSYLWSLAQQARFEQMLVRSLIAVVLVTGGAALAIYVGAPLVFERWTSGHVPFSDRLLGLLLLQAVTGTGTTVVGWALVASNKHQIYSLACLGYALVFVLLLVLVIPVWGFAGAIAANVVLDLMYLGVVLPLLSAKVLHVSAARLLRATCTALGLIGLIALPVYMAATALPTGWNTVTALAVLAVASLATLFLLRRRWGLDCPDEAQPTQV